DDAARSYQLAQRVDDVGWNLEPALRCRALLRPIIFPTQHTDFLATGDTSGCEDIGQHRRLRSILSHQPEGRIEPCIDRDRSVSSATQVFGAREERWRPAWHDHKERFLEARIEA